MPDGQEPRQSAEGGPIAQALGPGATANAFAIDYAHVRPTRVSQTELDAAGSLLAELPLDRVPKPGGLPAGSKPLPIPRNRLLVGRDEDLKDLAARIKDDAAGPPTVVVSGIGGVGKTQLASEFAHSYGRFFAGGVFWLNLSDPASIREEVAACGGAGAMSLRPDFHALPLDERAGAVMSEWNGDLPRLLVLDDCADGRTLEAARPKAGGCRVLVTSRGPIADPALGVLAPLGLGPFSRGASVELLRGYCAGTGAWDEDLDKIADELGDLPLALDLAGRFLNKYQHITSAPQYLSDLQSDEVLGHRSLRGADGREASPTGHDTNVGRTFAVSYLKLRGGSPIDRLAIRLLARAARFEPGVPIERRVLLSTLDPANEEPTARELEEREDALGLLVELGLVTESETGPVSMHKLVAASARSELDDDGAQADVERAVGVYAVEVVKSGQPVRLEPLMPHLRHAVEAARDRDDEPAYLVRFAMGHALGGLGYSAEAVPYLKSAVEHNVARLESAAGLTARERDELVWLVMRQRNDVLVALERAGDDEGALAMHEALLEDRRNNLPQPHEDVASTLTNIGVIKAEQSLLHEVGPRYEESLAIREEVLARTPADHPERRQLLRDVAESHGNLGALSMDLGRPREAAVSHRRALDIYEDIEETEHERYANITMAHGAAVGLLGDFGGAREDLKLALGVHGRVLQEDNPRIGKNLILLGALLAEEAGRNGRPTDAQGREILDAARGHLAEALDFLERFAQGDNPLAAGVMRVAANVAREQGRHADAASLLTRADAIRGVVLRYANPDFIGKGVKIFAARGLYDEAELYARRFLDLLRFAAVGGSLETATAEFALGRLLQLRGREAEAAEHLQRALSLRAAILGEDRPETEIVRDCLSYARGREN